MYGLFPMRSVDTSEEFLANARAQIVDTRATFRAGARSLPLPDRRFDVVVSGLALNFVPDHPAAAEDEGRRFPLCQPEPLRGL